VLGRLRDQSGSGLVYVATRKEAETYAARLGSATTTAASAGPSAWRPSGPSRAGPRSWPPARSAWESTAPTCASSCHASVPGSLDEYYQEIGRCGRDGRPAAAICCYRAEDLGLLRYFAAGLPDERDLAAVAAAASRPVTRRELAARTGMPSRAARGTAQPAGIGRRRPPPPPGRAGRRRATPHAGRGQGGGARPPPPVGRALAGGDDAPIRRDDRLPPPVPAAVLRRGGIRRLRTLRQLRRGPVPAVVPSGIFSPGERVEHHEWGPGPSSSAPKMTGSPCSSTSTAYKELAAHVVSAKHLLAERQRVMTAGVAPGGRPRAAASGWPSGTPG